MAAITVQSVDPSGLTPSFSAVNSADTLAVDSSERHFLYVKNGGGGSINVTITAQQTSVNVSGVGDLAISDEVVAVGAGADAIIGPFTQAFINASGSVEIAYSGTTSVTAAGLKLPKQY